LTTPGAIVSVNGEEPRRVGSEGQLSFEMPLNRDYTVRIANGDDYLPITKSGRLVSKRVVIDEEPVSRYSIVRVPSPPEGVDVLVDGAPYPAANVLRSASELVIGRIAPGKREIRLRHAAKGEASYSFDLEAGDDLTWPAQFVAALGSLVLTSEPGARVYVDKEYVADVPSTGVLKVGDLEMGAHEVRITKTEFEDWTATIQIATPAAIERAARLVRRASATELFDDFKGGVGQWQSVAPGATVGGDGLALSGAAAPTLTRSSYGDFKMTFYVTLRNGAGAAWVVRAADAKNYYRFYLSGPAGSIPNRFVVDVVRDGVADESLRRTIPLPIALEPGARFTIELLAAGNTIKSSLRIESVSAQARMGEVITLSSYTDERNSFPFGAVGFCTVGPESFVVSELFVVPQR
jgi:hypothetical protein